MKPTVETSDDDGHIFANDPVRRALYVAGVELIRGGRHIVPCDGKRPVAGKRWHERPVNDALLAHYLSRAKEPTIGIKLGADSFLDIEADSAEEEALVAKLFDGCDVPRTPTFKSRRGMHRLNFSSNGSGTKIGIRIGADKAAQSIVPPSAGREWLVSLEDAEPADLPPVVIERILEAARPQGQRRPARANDGNASSGKVYARALAAMRRIKVDDSEADGSKRLFACGCRCVEFDLTDGESLATIREYEKLRPFPRAYGDEEILTRVRDAEKRVERGSAQKFKFRNTTDLGNAERFAEQHGADVRYCHLWGKWLAWDGRRWAIDTMGEIPRRAKRTARKIWEEARTAPKKAIRKRLGEWASASEKRDRLNAMIALAQSEHPIPIAVEQLDSHPWALNVLNGTLDLRTGTLREQWREDYLTKLCPLEYPTEAIDPELWLEFLDRIFAGNAQLIGFARRLVGMALVGEVLEHILALFYGAGANGTTVFIETICGMLGDDYAMNAPAGLLMLSKSDRHPTELADLHGKRFVAAVESEEHGRLSESFVKQLTGGDAIRARRCREDFWQFRPSHTVVLTTNHKPTIRGTDHGIWRRIRLVPFVVTIPDHEQDKQLAGKLRAEWPAILRWAMAGCLDWQRNGLQAPIEVTQATSTYRSDMDTLGEFIEERCTLGSN